MRARFVDLAGGLGDSCRGDGGGRSIHSGVSSGETVQILIPDAVYIYYENPNANYGTATFVRISFATGYLCMGLFHADLSAYAGRTLLAATLNLYNTVGATEKQYTGYEIWRTWEELEACYNERLTGVAWEEPGVEGDGDRSHVAFDAILLSAVGWYSWDVSGPVTAWLSGARTNYGVRIWPENKTAALASVASDDYLIDVSKRPYFELELA